MKQNFERLKSFFENYSEDKLRGLTGESSSEYIHHYLKRFKQGGALLDSSRLLEIGCGEGKCTQQLARMLPRSRITAVDISEENIKIAKKHYSMDNIEYKVANVVDPAWRPTGRYDLIFSFSVIQYFDNQSYASCQKKLYDSLNEGG
mgnify:CR=1 FL=1